MTRRGATIRAVVMALLVALACALVATPAFAHKPSDAYLTIDAAHASLAVRADVALRDLDPVIGLDDDKDGVLKWSEVLRHDADIRSYVRDRLKLMADGAPCPLSDAGKLELVGHTDGTYAVVRFDARCASASGDAPRAIAIDYRLFFDRDALHRGLVRVVAGGAPKTAILSADARTATIALDGAGAGSTIGGFGAALREGIVHIAEGTDHLLFVLALLLPSVLRRRETDGRFEWTPVPSFRAALLDVARIVTAFTIAHSITLSLAALEIVRLPSRFVETSIALSVVVAALNNVRPFLGAERWFAAFALGLLHGFGFSAVLVDLGLSHGELAKALVGFNVGVEVGQLAFVALVFPLAYAIRTKRFYVPLALRAASVVIALVALRWAIERAFDVKMV